jgi:hypothetical protein
VLFCGIRGQFLFPADQADLGRRKYMSDYLSVLNLRHTF